MVGSPPADLAHKDKTFHHSYSFSSTSTNTKHLQARSIRMAQNNEDAAKELKDLRAKIGLLTRCLNAKVGLPYNKLSKKTPNTVTLRLERLIEDLAAKKDSLEIKYLEAMSEKTKLEHKIQDLTILLCKHGISTQAARFILPAGSEVSDDESDH